MRVYRPPSQHRLGDRQYLLYAQMAIADLDEYIETFYNRIRRHSHLSEASPKAFEAVSKILKDVPAKPWEVQSNPFVHPISKMAGTSTLAYHNKIRS